MSVRWCLTARVYGCRYASAAWRPRRLHHRPRRSPPISLIASLSLARRQRQSPTRRAICKPRAGRRAHLGDDHCRGDGGGNGHHHLQRHHDDHARQPAESVSRQDAPQRAGLFSHSTFYAQRMPHDDDGPSPTGDFSPSSCVTAVAPRSASARRVWSIRLTRAVMANRVLWYRGDRRL